MAQVTDFSNWTLVEDPAHPNFTAAQTATNAVLTAGNGSIPNATDIGFQSVNGSNVANSSSGYAFKSDSDFSIAIDYSVSLPASYDGLAIGFGIGEDSDGTNSAGAVLALNSSSFFDRSFGAAARTNDVSSGAPLMFGGASLAGAMFVSYDALSGDITVGNGLTGASVAANSHVFSGIQNGWTNQSMLPSFFMRSDNTLGGAWSGGGTATATFSNFRILNGQACAIPEPSHLVLLAIGFLGLFLRRKR